MVKLIQKKSVIYFKPGKIKSESFNLRFKSKKLPVQAILKAMGEDEIFKKCVLGLKLCCETKPCPMHHQYKVIKEQLINLFDTRTIQHLANDINNGDVFINNKGQ